MGNDAIFVVMTISAIFICLISLLSDNLGRKKTFIIVSCITLVFSLLSIFSHNLYLIVFGMTVQFLCRWDGSSIIKGNPWFYTNMYTYASEMLGDRLRVIFQPIGFGFYGLGGILVNLLAIWINDYRFFIVLSTISILLLSLPYFYFIETPFFFYKTRNVEKLYECLVSICQWNYPKAELEAVTDQIQRKLKYGKYLNADDQEEQTNPNEEIISLLSQGNTEKLLDIKKPSKEVSSLREFFKKKNLKLFFKLLAINLQVQFIFCLSLIINKSLGIKDVYLSGILIGIFQTVGYFVGGPVAATFPRKSVNIASSVIVCLCSGLLMTVDIISNHFASYEEKPNAVRIIETSIWFIWGFVFEYHIF